MEVTRRRRRQSHSQQPANRHGSGEGGVLTNKQAVALGELFRTARTDQGLSLSSLAQELGWPRSSLSYLETGRSRDSSPERIARLAERLRIDPAQIDRLSGGYLAQSLPSVRTYFRSKSGASKAELDEIEHVVRQIQDKYRQRGKT
jgi:transcriptional regulator with XRE-family HTH domain